MCTLVSFYTQTGGVVRPDLLESNRELCEHSPQLEVLSVGKCYEDCPPPDILYVSGNIRRIILKKVEPGNFFWIDKFIKVEDSYFLLLWMVGDLLFPKLWLVRASPGPAFHAWRCTTGYNGKKGLPGGLTPYVQGSILAYSFPASKPGLRVLTENKTVVTQDNWWQSST